MTPAGLRLAGQVELAGLDGRTELAARRGAAEVRPQGLSGLPADLPPERVKLWMGIGRRRRMVCRVWVWRPAVPMWSTRSGMGMSG